MQDILIVGAGPTGLTAALELRRRGLRPQIVERDAGPTPLSKAVGVAPHSLDLLEASGATERLLARGVRMRGFQVWRGEDLLGQIDMRRLEHRFDFLLCLPQSETETAMAELLAEAGVQVGWRTELVGLRTEGERLVALLEGERGRREAAFDVVLGADGVHSRVREALGLAFEGRTHERLWSIADGRIANWPNDRLWGQLFVHANGDVGVVVPIAEDRFRAISNTPDALACAAPAYAAAEVLRTDTFHIPARQASRYGVGGAFLAGDAAHAHSPVGARGMNLGIEDAVAFAARLAAGTLAGYEAERRPVGRRWIDLSERLLAAVQAAGAGAALRDLAIGLIAHLPALQRPMLERVAGLRE
jgi:2-polyprenyl-6-methoxyphenol hydroxylase-like FAD-dependent oxidoreductase